MRCTRICVCGCVRMCFVTRERWKWSSQLCYQYLRHLAALVSTPVDAHIPWPHSRRCCGLIELIVSESRLLSWAGWSVWGPNSCEWKYFPSSTMLLVRRETMLDKITTPSSHKQTCRITASRTSCVHLEALQGTCQWAVLAVFVSFLSAWSALLKLWIGRCWLFWSSLAVILWMSCWVHSRSACVVDVETKYFLLGHECPMPLSWSRVVYIPGLPWCFTWINGDRFGPEFKPWPRKGITFTWAPSLISAD